MPIMKSLFYEQQGTDSCWNGYNPYHYGTLLRYRQISTDGRSFSFLLLIYAVILTKCLKKRKTFFKIVLFMQSSMKSGHFFRRRLLKSNQKGTK